MVSISSSTPLFANSKHIPLSIPDTEAYDTARRRRVRVVLGSFVIDGELDRVKGTGFRSRSGVSSVAIIK